MPYADPARQREYSREWLAVRRREYFAGKDCADCGSQERLELDHIDPRAKVDHKIWSWSAARREVELAKCQVLCHPCHLAKTKEHRESPHGAAHNRAKMTDADVVAIRLSTLSLRELGRQYGVDHGTIGRIKRHECYR